MASPQQGVVPSTGSPHTVHVAAGAFATTPGTHVRSPGGSPAQLHARVRADVNGNGNGNGNGSDVVSEASSAGADPETAALVEELRRRLEDMQQAAVQRSDAERVTQARLREQQQAQQEHAAQQQAKVGGCDGAVWSGGCCAVVARNVVNVGRLR